MLNGFLHGKLLENIPSFLSLECFRCLAYGRVSHSGFKSTRALIESSDTRL